MKQIIIYECFARILAQSGASLINEKDLNEAVKSKSGVINKYYKLNRKQI